MQSLETQKFKIILNCQSFLLSSYKEAFGFKKGLFIWCLWTSWSMDYTRKATWCHFNASPQLLQFRRTLQSCFAVKLHNCSTDNETSTEFSSAWGGNPFPFELTFLSNHFSLKLETVKLPSCNKPVIHNVQKCSDSTSSVLFSNPKITTGSSPVCQSSKLKHALQVMQLHETETDGLLKLLLSMPQLFPHAHCGCPWLFSDNKIQITVASPTPEKLDI